MGNLLYLIAVILVIIWAVGFLFHGLGSFGDGGIIHVLLVIAIIIILLKVIRRA
ncbi:MAG: lmo0937 family membrane protein [Sphingobacteriaceae bacterium]|nr:MAG: lmo0937 family membrane protein [Sphingobacteriaceae bacterium]